MNKELHKVGDYTLLLEEGSQVEDSITQLPSDTVGLVYYLSGDVRMAIEEGGNTLDFKKSKGMMSSFFVSAENTVTQIQEKNSELKKASIFLSKEKLSQLIGEEDSIVKNETIHKLLHPKDHFVSGSKGNINPFSAQTLENIFENEFAGKPKELFLESQVTTLLSDYLQGILSPTEPVPTQELDKLHNAKEILLEQMDSPPTLTELAKLTAMNTYSLKKGFKELFGQPVFKFLQNKRLDKAYELLENRDMSVQEAAWFVGYNSIGSFSNAFKKKFGFRPKDINKSLPLE